MDVVQKYVFMFTHFLPELKIFNRYERATMSRRRARFIWRIKQPTEFPRLKPNDFETSIVSDRVIELFVRYVSLEGLIYVGIWKPIFTNRVLVILTYLRIKNKKKTIISPFTLIDVSVLVSSREHMRARRVFNAQSRAFSNPLSVLTRWVHGGPGRYRSMCARIFPLTLPKDKLQLKS